MSQERGEALNLNCTAALEPSRMVPERGKAARSAWKGKKRKEENIKAHTNSKSIKVRFVSVIYEPAGRFV